MTEFEQKLDELLIAFANRIEAMPVGKTYGWEAEKQALLSLIADERLNEARVCRLLSEEYGSEALTLIDRRIEKYKALSTKQGE